MWCTPSSNIARVVGARLVAVVSADGAAGKTGARGEFVRWLGSDIIFLALPVFSGFLGGFIFPIAGALCLNNEEERGRTAGINYGRDLFGSCIGALVTGLFLLPIMGIPKTCLVIAALNFKILLVLIAGVIFS